MPLQYSNVLIALNGRTEPALLLVVSQGSSLGNLHASSCHHLQILGLFIVRFSPAGGMMENLRVAFHDCKTKPFSCLCREAGMFPIIGFLLRRIVVHWWGSVDISTGLLPLLQRI